MKWFSKIFLSFLGLVMISSVLSAQPEPTQKELENVLKRFMNWRFGTMSLYRIQTITDVKRAIKSLEEKKSGIQMDAATMNSIDSVSRSIIERGVMGGASSEEIRNEIVNSGLPLPEMNAFEAVFNFYKKKMEGGGDQSVENAYLVTTRPEKGQIPSTIIALIVSFNPIDNLEKNLRSVGPSEIYTYDELQAFKLDSTFSSPNLYDLMVNTLMQQNYSNKTLEAQGIGNPEWFAVKVHGKTYSIVSKEGDVSSEDIQRFLRISDAQANDITLKQNELVISPDLISWKRYDLPMYPDASGNMIVDSFMTVNSALPNFGLELRYGMDNINYPSFFSERLNLNAIWQSVKLGIILPTDGWASLGNDMYGYNRTLSYGGVGINGSFDFPIKVIPQSGIFHLDGAFVFGDAKDASFRSKYNPVANNLIDNDSLMNVWNTHMGEEYRKFNRNFDYLIRANAQFHYTFGVSIDEDYWLRFGIGGTIYNVEYWRNFVESTGDEIDPYKIVYKKDKDETVGGISGKLEFMVKNIRTPYGASISYFDESLGINAWLQIPIVQNTLALKLDAKGFYSAFKDTPHVWENSSVFIGSARFVVNF